LNNIRIYKAAQFFFRYVGTTSKFCAPEGWHKGQVHIEDPQISAIKTTWHLEFVHTWCIANAVNVTWLSGVLQGKGKVAPVDTLKAYRKGRWIAYTRYTCVDSSWNVMTHGYAQEGKWRGNWRMEWVASILHASMVHGVSSITTADAHTSAVSNRLNWRPRRFKRTCMFRRKMKSGFCAGETSYGTWVEFIGSTHSLRYCLCVYLYLRRKVYSYPVKQTKIIFSQQKRKQPSLPSRNNNLLFIISWPHYTPPHSMSSLTWLLASVTQFRWLSPTVFSVWSSLYATPPTCHQRFLECTLTV